MIASWLVEVTRKVLALATLKENWDSYGGLPIDPQSREHACALLVMLATRMPPLSMPHVGPCSAGNVCVAWYEDTWTLDDAEVYPDGHVEYYYESGEKHSTTRPLVEIEACAPDTKSFMEFLVKRLAADGNER